MRGSDPESEVAETHAKAAGVLAALGVRPGRPRAESVRPKLADDPRVRAALDGRRASLAPFWLRMQERSEGLAGHALVVDGEDTFTAMLAHVLRSSGLEVTVRRYDEEGLREAVLAHEGPVVLGPGPGDPADLTDPKMRILRNLTAEVIRSHPHGVLGVCLGHELIAAELGLEIVRKEVPYQGAQTTIELFGGRRRSASTTASWRAATKTPTRSWPPTASRSAGPRTARCTRCAGPGSPVCSSIRSRS
ncbi:hypothetical protein SPURM210S_01099 [Streptomyces purpurascens]